MNPPNGLTAIVAKPEKMPERANRITKPTTRR
jgi:hypothetical protein